MRLVWSEFVATFGLLSVIWGCSRRPLPQPYRLLSAPYRRSLLVHIFHVVRQSCGHLGTRRE